jgi:large subunit ribosomal protein L30
MRRQPRRRNPRPKRRRRPELDVAKKKLEIVLRRSPVGQPLTQRRVVKALGLRRLRQCVVRDDHPTIRGMVAKISHLVEVRVHASS